MKSARHLLIAIACAIPPLATSAALGDSWDGYATLSATTDRFTSAASVLYDPGFRNCPTGYASDCHWTLSGDHSIDGTAYNPFYADGLSYRGTLTGDAARNQCATASVNGQAVLWLGGVVVLYSDSPVYMSNLVCAPLPPQCTLSVSSAGGGNLSPNPTGMYDCGIFFTLTAVAATGYHFVNWSGDLFSDSATITFTLNTDITLFASFDADTPPPPADCVCGCATYPGETQFQEDCSPIVINFSRGADYRLTGSNSPVLFDIGGTGFPISIGWTAPTCDEAFLWIDRNHNGRVDGGNELFGNAMHVLNGALAMNGFEALRQYDQNGDGVIDGRDPIWPYLMLWRDLNHNGLSEPDELQRVSGSGVVAIELGYHWEGRHDTFGNLFKFESKVWLSNPSGQASASPVYDIFFKPARSATP